MANRINHKANGGSFQKGDDERRNKSGQRNKAAVQFSKSLREFIVQEGESKLTDRDGKRYKKIELVVRQLYNKAIAGEGWAVTFIAERVEGKVKDQIEHSGGINLDHIDVILHDGGNSDRNSGSN